MTQPTIEDFQVDLTNSLKGKIDLNDLKDVSAPNPSDGEVIVWNNSSNKWEPGAGGGGGGTGSSFYFEFNGTTGAAVTMPAGWSVVRDSAGVFTLTHNLNATDLGYAFMILGVGVTLAFNITTVSANSIVIRVGGGIDTAGNIGGRLIADSSPVGVSNSGGSFYFEVDGATGNGIVLPAGWTSTRDAAGVYTIVHNLNTTELGFAYQRIEALGGINIPSTITNITANEFTVVWGLSGVDVTFGGRISTGAGGSATVAASGTGYTVLSNGMIFYELVMPSGTLAGASAVITLPIANNNAELLQFDFKFTATGFNKDIMYITNLSTTSITVINDSATVNPVAINFNIIAL